MALRLTFKQSVSTFLRNAIFLNPTTTQQNLSYSQICYLKTCGFCSNWRPSSRASASTNQQLLPLHACCVVPSRQYGRKVKPKPQRLTFFEYSGDLRTIPELNKDDLLYPYLDHEEELKSDEIGRKLASVEFASKAEKDKHKRQLVQDRIVKLFGPDSELEQRIAVFTLKVREMIPYCIENSTDKYQKIWLLKSIFHRRRLLNQLREIDYERFEWLLRELKIRFVVPQDQDAWKGWKHNLREATKDEKLEVQRNKLKEFKAKLEAEKEIFLQEKDKILAEIERDLEKFGLSREILDDEQKKEVEKKRPHKILTWEERLKLGMTDKIKDYYG